MTQLARVVVAFALALGVTSAHADSGVSVRLRFNASVRGEFVVACDGGKPSRVAINPERDGMVGAPEKLLQLARGKHSLAIEWQGTRRQYALDAQKNIGLDIAVEKTTISVTPFAFDRHGVVY
jgi:hypothetical protein